MEENSEVPMETDVSSTTGDALEAINMTETLDNIETIIVVENVSEESPNSNGIKLFADPEPMESSEEVPISQSPQVNKDQNNSLMETSESNMPFQKSEESPKDVSENNDEAKSPCMHDEQQPCNNKLKSPSKLEHLQNTSSSKEKSLFKPTQLQNTSNNTEKSPLKKDNHLKRYKIKDSSPLKTGECQKTSTSKDKTPVKIVQQPKISNEKLKTPSKPDQTHKILNEKDKSPSKADQPQKISKEKHRSPSKHDKPQKILNDKEKSPLNTVQPENCIAKEKSPLKTVQPENSCIDKEKSPLKTMQPENSCISKEKSPLKTTQPENSCISKEKSPLKTMQQENSCISKEKSPLRTTQPENSCISKEKSPLKTTQPENSCISKEKSPLKTTEPENSCISKEKSPLKTTEPENSCISKEKSPLKTTEPENSCISKEKSPLKTTEPENSCINKEKSPLKTDQSQETCNIKHNSLSKSNHKHDIGKLLESTVETKESTNVELNSNSETVSEEPLVTPMEVLSPDNPNDQTKSLLNESDDKTINDNEIVSKEDELSESNTLENCDKDDSQSEMNSDIEKDHNKNISRELKSLIKSARESKIISECNLVTSKTRKSRSALDTSLNSTVESDKIQEVRRSSINSQKSNCSEKSEKAPKRSMRSQNPEFVNKVKQFLNSVTGKFQKGDSDDELEVKKETQIETVYSPSKKKKHIVPMDVDSSENTNKLRTDPYCWRCHWAVEQIANEKGHPPMQCTVCPRTIHFKCLTSNERNKIAAEKSWVCPECLGVLHAESSETRSPAMKKVSLGVLCELLHYALERMKNLNGVEPFMQPVDRTSFPDYDKYVVHPMDLSLMKDNITDGLYGSTEAFLADAQWILHNSIIFNTLQSKLTGGARALVRSCKAECGEIEACAECYAGAHARRPTWFTDVCSTPHMLLWAKLKGFPYWPAKGMSVSSAGMVDVRFFGAHDRAWVPARDCFLFCEKDPNNFRSKRQDILDSMQEAEQHIRNISRKYGQFVYPPFKTQFDPTKVIEQLKTMIPTFDGEVGAPVNKPVISSPSVSKGKSRSNSSKSSKSSGNDGDVSESEDVQVSRKMADGAEIKGEEDFTVDKIKSMEVVETVKKETSRKRRRSDLEEAVITIMDNSSKEKRRKIESEVNIKKEIIKKAIDEKENVSITEEVNKITEVTEKDKEVLTTDKVIPSISKIENEPTTLVTPGKTTPRVKPIRISISRDNDKAVPIIVKPDKTDIEKDKIGDKHKSQKRRNSRNKSVNNQNGKVDKPEAKSEKDNVLNIIAKEKNKDVNTYRNKAMEGDKHEKIKTNTASPKPSKDGLKFDDNTTLAVIARDGSKTNVTGLPTISCVRSLSTTAQSSDTTSKTTTSSKMVEVTVTAGSNSSIFIPTSTDNIRNMKEVANKLQILRNDKDPPLVGRVGVRAFARMTSPERQINKSTDNVEVEIKSEPIDFDDADRQVEKIDLMKQISLRPVNPPLNSNLREVRINKVLVAPLTRKTVSKPPDVRIKAKKTFPQPRKVDDGRSELNSKNSMVYIPIQPPSTQAPVRPTRPITINGTANTQAVRPQVSTTASIANSIVNTVTTPLVPVSMNSNVQPSFAVVTSTTNNAVCVPTVGQASTVGQVNQIGQTSTLGAISNVGQTTNLAQMTTVSSVSTVGQLPTIGQMNAIGQVAANVHTVPLITSVNGQWTFSLQPIMSVGGLDESSPLINGLSDRSASIAPMASLPGVQPLQVPALNTICNINPDNPGEPPRLQQRPLVNPLDPRVPVGCAPPPSTAGPVTAKLNQNAVKLTDFFRTLLEDTLDKVDEPAAQATLLKMQVEHTQWRHVQEIRELKHNHELTIMEMRASYEKEKARAVSEARRIAQVELEAAVKATKTKQWCANCSQEAQFYCCWNTSYCDYPCQKAHWNTHYAHCTQQRNTPNNGDNGNSIEKRLQPAPDNLPKSAPAPTLTVGSRLTPTRVFTQENPPQKTSIIVSMVEDHSGNQTMKCVGTYKPPGSAQVSPLIINKQIMNNDESSKKVVTSGGYLIVGAGSTPLVTPPRRTHTIQYYT